MPLKEAGRYQHFMQVRFIQYRLQRTKSSIENEKTMKHASNQTVEQIKFAGPQGTWIWYKSHGVCFPQMVFTLPKWKIQEQGNLFHPQISYLKISFFLPCNVNMYFWNHVQSLVFQFFTWDCRFIPAKKHIG